MDIREYLSHYRVLICKRCRTAVYPQILAQHLRQFHMRDNPSLASSKLVQIFVDETLPELLDRPLLDPQKDPLIVPALDCDPFDHLEVHRGYGCNYCRFVCKPESAM